MLKIFLFLLIVPRVSGQLQINLLEDLNKLILFVFQFCVSSMKTINSLCDFYWNFKFKFKFKIKMKTIIQSFISVFMCNMLCFSGVNSTSDYVQSFERVAVFHNHVTYGHLGVTIDFDGYLNHFHVLRKSVLSFEEKHMSVYMKSVFSVALGIVRGRELVSNAM